MSDDFIDKEEQNEENIPTPENGHSDYKPTDTKNKNGTATSPCAGNGTKTTS